MTTGFEVLIAKHAPALAAKGATLLASRAGRALRDKLLGDETAQALERAYGQAFDALLVAGRAAGLDPAARDLAHQFVEEFVANDEVQAWLLDLALDDHPLPIEDVRRRFAFLDGELAWFPGGFERAINAWIDGLREGLIREARKPANPLHNRVALAQVAILQHNMEEQGERLERIEKLVSAPGAGGAVAPPIPGIIPAGGAAVSAGTPSGAIHAEITRAAEPYLQGEPQTAISQLMRFRVERWGELDARARYRVLANLGNAHEVRQEHTAAARYYLEAVSYQPDDPDARALEALAYQYLDRPADAFRLADGLRSQYPHHARLVAIWARTAPADTAFDQIEAAIPAHLRDEAEIALALAQRALDAADLQRAAIYARAALRAAPPWEAAQSLLATILLTDAQVGWASSLGATLPEPAAELVREAVALLSQVLDRLRPFGHPEERARLYLNRATAHTMLGDAEEADRDLQIAVDLAPRQREVVLRRATALHGRGQANRAIEILDEYVTADPDATLELVLARMRVLRDAEADRATALAHLERLLPHLGREDDQVRTDVIETLVEIHARENAFESAGQLLRDLPDDLLTPVTALALQADIKRREGNIAAAQDLARQALAVADTATPSPERRRLAVLAQELGWCDQALPLWRQFVPTDRVTPDTPRLLACAQECHADGVILEFCRALREHGVFDPACFDAELALLEHYHAIPEAMRLMEEYLRAPSDARLADQVRIRLALVAVRTDQQELIARLIPDLPPVGTVEVWQGRAVVDVLRYGPEPTRAVDYAYELWRRYPEEYAAFEAIIAAPNVISGPDIPIRTTPLIEASTAVRVHEERSGEERWWIIEDSPDPQRRWDELPPDDPLALALHGKAVGDQVSLPGRPFYPRTVMIREIVPKTVYRWRWCSEHLADLFPDRASIEAVHFRTGPDDDIDLGPIVDHAEHHATELRRVELLYTQGPLSLHTFATRFGESVIDTVAHLAARPDLPIRCTRGTDRSELVGAREAARTAEALVLDASALGTLLLLGEVDLLRELPIPVIISAGTMQLARDLVRDAPEPERTMAPAAAARRLTRLRYLRDTLEAVCQIESGTVLAALPPDQRERLAQFCGRDGAEAVVLASRPGRVLWTDDFVVAYLAGRELGCRSAPTQPVLVRWREVGLLPNVRGARAMVRLVAAGYTGTILHPADILGVLEDGGWHSDAPLAVAAFDWLTRAPLTQDGLLRVVLSVLKPLWQRAPLPSLARSATWHLLDRLGARAEAIVRALRGAVDAIFGLDVIRAAHVDDVIATWIAFRWPESEATGRPHSRG